jgi:hypothetical protein
MEQDLGQLLFTEYGLKIYFYIALFIGVLSSFAAEMYYQWSKEYTWAKKHNLVFLANAIIAFATMATVNSLYVDTFMIAGCFILNFVISVIVSVTFGKTWIPKIVAKINVMLGKKLDEENK